MYADRIDAGRQLAKALHGFARVKPLVLGLPRGGVVVAAEIARVLAGDLDVLLVKKLRAPGNPELALGAIGEDGHTFLNPGVGRIYGVDDKYLQLETRERVAEMATQRGLYRSVKPHIPVVNRVVIVVDDGLATGASMIAAVQVTAAAKPQRLIVAVPVGPPETLQVLKEMSETDEVVCLHAPTWFAGVGQFYADFTQVEDTEVVRILKEFA